MEQKIGIRLTEISFERYEHATVTFELYVEGFQTGDSRRRLVLLTREVPCVSRKDLPLQDYDAIVINAANKLKDEFKDIAEFLGRTYPTRLTG